MGQPRTLNPTDRELLKTIVDALKAKAGQEEAMADVVATGGVATNPFFNAAGIVAAYGQGVTGKAKYAAVAWLMSDQFRDIKAGDLSRPEAMLFSQAVALEAIFVNLSRRSVGAHGNPGFHEKYLALAFKAQSQSRAALQALGELRYPRSAMFFGQANIGAQQVITNQRPARAGKWNQRTN